MADKLLKTLDFGTGDVYRPAPRWEDIQNKPEDIGGGGTADAVEWNNVQNKPFGEYETGGDTLTWDGNTDGCDAFQGMCYKVSDVVPTLAEISGGGSVTINGVSDSFDASLVHNEDGLVFIGEGIPAVCFLDENIANAMGISAGTYFMSVPSMGIEVTSFTINGYTGFPYIEKLDKRYLPDSSPIILYSGADYYLYTNNDTSDTGKRITKAQLKDFFSTGNLLYVYINTVSTHLLCIMVTIENNEEWGSVECGGIKFYTAEYTG